MNTGIGSMAFARPVLALAATVMLARLAATVTADILSLNTVIGRLNAELVALLIKVRG